MEERTQRPEPAAFGRSPYDGCVAAATARGWRVGLQFLSVNWLAVLVAAIVNMAVGFLWYGPLFSGLFLRLIGKREEEIEASPLVYPLGFVMGLVTTYVLAVIIGSAGVTTWWGGAVTAPWCGSPSAP